MSNTTIPTMQLRFVQRMATRPIHGMRGTFMEEYPIRVLQQAFCPVDSGKLEWRDVPMVVEETEEGAP